MKVENEKTKNYLNLTTKKRYSTTNRWTVLFSFLFPYFLFEGVSKVTDSDQVMPHF